MHRLSLLVSLIGVLTAGASAEDVGGYERQVRPLMTKYCVSCHNAEDHEGDLSLEGLTEIDSRRADSSVWKRVIEMLEVGWMPPEEAPQPTSEERRQLIASIAELLRGFDCQPDQDPGRVTIRRLNRNEYNNTVRDLLGVALQPADDFPADDVGESFDNIGDVLSLPPLLMEKYLDAAEQLASAAIISPESRQPPRQRRAGQQLTLLGNANVKQELDLGDAYSFFTEGGVGCSFDIPTAGDYDVRLHAEADQAGPESAKAELQVDGRRIGILEIDAVRGSSQTYQRKTKLLPGKVFVSAEFINDYYRPASDEKPGLDRNLVIHWIELVGPAQQQPFPDSHGRLVLARPEPARSLHKASLLCLQPFVQRAFRREVSDTEVTPFVNLVELAVTQGESFERGLQVAITAVLVSPQFLFRIERDPDPNDPARQHALSQYELANRLSYFLWSSMPDDRLFELAAQQRLDRDDVLRQEVDRMLRNPRSNQLVENFAGQWLNLRSLDRVTPDPAAFPGFEPELRDDMKRETLLFFADVMRENRSILDFVLGDFTYLNDRLARHYGIPGFEGSDFQRRPQPSHRRAGVLAHGSVLTLTSHPARTSPVKRGKWIMENLLGTPPPSPPADVPALEESQAAAPHATLREQLELHRSQKTCAVCHRQMDELGFGLENFDAIGRWRDSDRGLEVDARGELPGGVHFSGPAELARVLGNRPEQIGRCLTEKMMIYALGRGLRDFDRCAVDKIVDRLAANDYRFQELVNGIVLSDPFRRRRGEEPQR